MPLESDALIDRQRLKRRLTFWRVLAAAALVLAAIVATPHRTRLGGAHVARLAITGVIGNGTEQIDSLTRLRDDPSVRAVLLHLDTPGGAVGGGEGIHDAVADLARTKPIVAVMDGTAASAGYMIAVAAPHIVARDSTLTGSIGVILQLGNISGLLEKIGVQSTPLVSGPLKGAGDITAPLTDPQRQYLQGLVADLYDQFVGLVATGRHMPPARVRQLADGRAYTGRQAFALGLVDQIGGEQQAMSWLRTQRHLTAGLPIEDVEKDENWYARFARSTLAGLIGPGALGGSLAQSLHVDGVYALWQPSLPGN